MSRLKESEMRPVEVLAARAICKAHGDYSWRHLRDVKGNPSTAFAYYEYLRMGRAAVRAIEKAYAGGRVAKWMVPR